jgi:hypothetical protein
MLEGGRMCGRGDTKIAKKKTSEEVDPEIVNIFATEFQVPV